MSNGAAEPLLAVGSVQPVERECEVPFSTALVELRVRLVPGVAVPNLYSRVLIDGARVQERELALDVGTGSGVVGAAMSARFGCRVAVSDVDAVAVAVARRNVTAVTGDASQCVAFVGDGLRPLRSASVDVILSQPPQTPVPPDQPSATPLITDGGPDGLCFIREVVEEAARVLTSFGRLYVVLASYLPLEQFEADAADLGFNTQVVSRTKCELSPMAWARREYLEREVGWDVATTVEGLAYMELYVYELVRSERPVTP